ncbi:hypothetical protein [Salirhabdus sp. Marseille-P4669]|uniref:hypothetical protein n=1 Tax=Salirhabdus sp. Marseille-P4669 TaxID=2042310 RepID=UPI000C7BE00C|nr:hypothetical protein [Salirhabdus sp. Marseille-P4669]
MNKNELEKKIIENYQSDENMMILVFAQWCVNNSLDPRAVYYQAYPNQEMNPSLERTLELTVPKEESEEIANGTVLNVLELFGNHDLAFVVAEKIEEMKSNKE